VSGTPEGWCGTPDPNAVNLLKTTAPTGVTYKFRKAYVGAPRPDFNGGPITQAAFSRVAQNALAVEEVAWHRDRTVSMNAAPVDVNKMDLNAVFVDGHAKFVHGKQWLVNNPLHDLGWGYPQPDGADMDWFLSDAGYTACPRCNEASPGTGDAHDID
jgi:prepilin-type processing-associated H-X9-DG protein